MFLSEFIHASLAHGARLIDPALQVGAELWMDAVTLAQQLFALYAALLAPWVTAF